MKYSQTVVSVNSINLYVVSPSEYVHFGAFLRSVPVARRIGDYAHAAARCLYAIYKRLCKACSHRCAADLSALIASVDPSARFLLPSEVTAASAAVKAGIDLTTAHMFLSNRSHIEKVVHILQTHNVSQEVVYGTDHRLLFHVVVKFLLISLHDIYALWRCKTILTPTDIASYKEFVSSFCLCWNSLGWKPTLWVHWLFSHSTFFSLRSMLTCTPSDHAFSRLSQFSSNYA